MLLDPLPELPGVSYIMPVLNEEEHLAEAVRTILDQDYAGQKEIILALGPSTDRSTSIAEALASTDQRVHLLENPGREIPIALNLALEASQYPVVIRVDAHSELEPDYTRLSIEILRSTGAASLGGVMRAAGHSPVQRAIAAAYNSPYGLGGGTYHGEGSAGPAESAYLGVFRREALEAVGGYDPSIRRGEDWELNLRIRQAGGVVWFDPTLRVTYRPRASFRDLGRQFFATGAWRAVLVRRYPSRTPWRFFAPGTLVLGLLFSVLVGGAQLAGFTPWWSWWSLIHLIPVLYIAALVFATFRLSGLPGFRARLRGLAALAIMHLTWGCGFLAGTVGFAGRTVDRSRV